MSPSISPFASSIRGSAVVDFRRRADALEAKGISVVDFGIGEPDFASPPPVKEALIRAIRDGHDKYVDPKGLLALREAIASFVERNFSHEIRRPYENTSYFEGSTKQHPDEDIIQVQIWMQDNYNRQINLSEVASRFEMSVRNFNRRFKNATAQTPLQYLQRVRIEIAKDLLQTSNLNVSEVADKIGYQDVGYFTALFVKLLATSPREYRATVRAKLFSAD